MKNYERLGATGALVLSLALLVVASPALGAANKVTEYPLGSGAFFSGAIAPSPDGEMWFAFSRGQEGVSRSSQNFEEKIGRITASGQIAEFSLQTKYASPAGIVAGPDGNMWFTEGLSNRVGRITRDGQITEFPVGGQTIGIAKGAEGNLWFTESRHDCCGGGEEGKIGMITPAGAVSEFPTPLRASAPGPIVAGPDGNLLFGQGYVDRIGQINPSGQITEIALPGPPGSGCKPPLEWCHHVSGFAPGADGSIWFTASPFTASPSIGRLSTDGSITEFSAPKASAPQGPITLGGDGRLWFTIGQQGKLGRMTPSGRFSTLRLPDAKRYPANIATGPDGSIWYTALGEGPCEGGGGTCMAQILKNAGAVGHITLGPLTTEIARQRSRVQGRWAKLRLTCSGGKASDICHGKLRLTSRGHSRTLARVFYTLAADETRAIGVRLNKRALALLAFHPRIRATALTKVRGGSRSTRTILLKRKARHRVRQPKS